MTDIDPRVTVAHETAARTANLQYRGFAWWSIALCVGMGVMIRFDFDLKWIVALGFSGMTLILGTLAIEIGRRIDVRCAYIEQCCTDIDRQAP